MAKLLEFVEKTLNDMPLLVMVKDTSPRVGGIRVWRDAIRCTIGFDIFTDFRCSISFIAQYDTAGKRYPRENFNRNSTIIDIAWSKMQFNRIA